MKKALLCTPLFLREAKGTGKLLVIFMAVLTMYASMITAMFDPSLGESLATMAESMPQIFAAFGMLNVSATLLEFLTNYLYGFLLVVFPLVFIILLTNRLVARYVDRGSMAYLLAAPVPRRRVMRTQIAVLCLSLVLLTGYVTLLCIVLAEAMFPGQLDVPHFLAVNAGCLCLQLFFAGVCFLPSCLCNDSRTSAGIGGGLCIAFVLVQMVSQVGDKFDWLRFATPLTLFDTADLMAGEAAGAWKAAILLAGGFALMLVGAEGFARRDLPL